MVHPMHLHDVFVEIDNGAGLAYKPRKQTINVKLAELSSFNFTYDEPVTFHFIATCCSICKWPGVRRELRRRLHQTYGVLAVQGLAPLWFNVEASAFPPGRGDRAR